MRERGFDGVNAVPPIQFAVSSGHGIGKNILAKGYELTVMANKNRGPVDDLIAKGAHERNNAMAVAKDSDLVIICVTGSPQVEHIVHGEYGLINAMRPGLIIADCSTAEPESTKRLAADVEAKGGHFVDTPMTADVGSFCRRAIKSRPVAMFESARTDNAKYSSNSVAIQV